MFCLGKNCVSLPLLWEGYIIQRQILPQDISLMILPNPLLVTEGMDLEAFPAGEILYVETNGAIRKYLLIYGKPLNREIEGLTVRA